MSAYDKVHDRRNRVKWTRIDPTKPSGLHRPKLDGDVGWDLASMVSFVLPPGGAADVPVNLRIAMPDGMYADIRNRSSMARRGLLIDQNLIDTGYRGPMFVWMRNMSNETVTIAEGERIAQIVFHRWSVVWDFEVLEDEFPANTERGVAGMGSTGRI